MVYSHFFIIFMGITVGTLISTLVKHHYAYKCPTFGGPTQCLSSDYALTHYDIFFMLHFNLYVRCLLQLVSDILEPEILPM